MPATSATFTKVFVYGTLKRGEPNHYWLTNAENGFGRFFSCGKTVTKLPLVVGTRYNIPFLLNKPGVGNQINGEIYEVNELMLKNLDILEDYPTLYDRVAHQIELADG